VPTTVPVRLVVRGLRGGHSGLNIIENRANAIKLVTRVMLAAIDRGIRVDLVAIEGGSKHNAIPREAFATFRTTSRKLGALKKVVAKALADLREEFGSIEPDLQVEFTEVAEEPALAMVLDKASRNRLLHLLNAMPHGALAMSREVPGLVETSNNLAVVKTEAEHALVVTSHRSSVMPALYAVGEQIRSLGLLCGATVDVHDAYPGWKPNPTSPLVQRTVAVYQRLFGSQPVLKAVHAGLECGLLLEKVPGMDVVSIGPEIRNPHSPDEVVQISTVGRFYQVIKTLVQDLA
jgi:dipeptidase D